MALSPNTAYTLWAYALPFGTLLPSVATSYMLETLDRVKSLHESPFSSISSKEEISRLHQPIEN